MPRIGAIAAVVAMVAVAQAGCSRSGITGPGEPRAGRNGVAATEPHGADGTAPDDGSDNSPDSPTNVGTGGKAPSAAASPPGEPPANGMEPPAATQDDATPEEPPAVAIPACDAFSEIWTDTRCTSCLDKADDACAGLWERIERECTPSRACAGRHCLACRPDFCPWCGPEECDIRDTCACIATCLPRTQTPCHERWSELTRCYADACGSRCAGS